MSVRCLHDIKYDDAVFVHHLQPLVTDRALHSCSVIVTRNNIRVLLKDV